MQNLFLYLIFVSILLSSIRYFLIFWSIRKNILSSVKCLAQSANQIPDYLKELFQSPIAKLQQLGFEFCTYLQIEREDHPYHPILWEA